MRRKDLSGAKEWRGAVELMSSRIVCRFGALKISRSRRLVMRRVFEGGVGWTRAGREERSRDRGVLAPEERRDCSGDSSGDDREDIVAVVPV